MAVVLTIETKLVYDEVPGTGVIGREAAIASAVRDVQQVLSEQLSAERVEATLVSKTGERGRR